MLKVLLIPFSLITVCFIFTVFVSNIYAQVFEFNEKDYFDTEEDEEKNPTTTNSQDISATTNTEDNDKENCINNQIESVLSSNNNDMNPDSYYSSAIHRIGDCEVCRVVSHAENRSRNQSFPRTSPGADHDRHLCYSSQEYCLSQDLQRRTKKASPCACPWFTRFN